MGYEKHTESKVAAVYSCKVAMRLQTEGSGRCMQVYKGDSRSFLWI